MKKNEPLRYVIRSHDLTVLARCLSPEIAGRVVESMIPLFSELYIDVEESTRGGDRASYRVSPDHVFRLPAVYELSAAEMVARFGRIDLETRGLPMVG